MDVNKLDVRVTYFVRRNISCRVVYFLGENLIATHLLLFEFKTQVALLKTELSKSDLVLPKLVGSVYENVKYSLRPTANSLNLQKT